jgi:hypothetical protein
MATQRIISSDFLSKTLNGTQFLLSEVRIRTAFEITIYYRIIKYVITLISSGIKHFSMKDPNAKIRNKTKS